MGLLPVRLWQPDASFSVMYRTRSVSIFAIGLRFQLPILDMTQENITESLTKILDDPESAALTAQQGPAFVRHVHDGQFSVDSLASFLTDPAERATKKVRRARRGRIVMLVDNNVTPDSRVQKQARSAAERGWHVTLLGRRRDKERAKWRLGGANVQLVDVGRQPDRQPHLLRSGHLRSPLAYGRPDVASYREQQFKAQKADFDIRRAVARLDSTGRKKEPAKKAMLGLRRQRLILAVTRRWVDLRAAKTRELYDAAKR